MPQKPHQIMLQQWQAERAEARRKDELQEFVKSVEEILKADERKHRKG